MRLRYEPILTGWPPIVCWRGVGNKSQTSDAGEMPRQRIPPSWLQRWTAMKQPTDSDIRVIEGFLHTLCAGRRIAATEIARVAHELWPMRQRSRPVWLAIGDTTIGIFLQEPKVLRESHRFRIVPLTWELWP
jgi:hypothetical protein